MSRLASSPTGVPPPLSRDARRGPTTTPTRAAPPVAAVTTHGGGVVVVRHADPSSPSALRGPPLRGRMDIAQPNLVSAVALRDHIAQSLGVPSDEVSVTPETTAIATVDFTVSNARHLYPDDAAVARALSADIRLRMNLNKLLRVHNAGAFTFVLREPHVSDRAWSSVTASNFFELVDAGLVAAVDACGASEGDALDALDSTIRIAFAEAVAPREVQQLRRELDRAVAKVADMRIELNELERRNDTTELQRELDREIANRRTVERRYQDLVEAESAWKEQAARLDREVNSSKPELRRLRELLTQLETENAKLEVAKKQKEEELRIMRLDSAANLDRLVANLNDAEKELALWRQRCDALQAEKELARRSYQTNEEALTLRLSRTERKLFEVTQGRGVVAAALRSGSSSVTGTGRERSSSPRSRSHGSDAASSAFAVPNVSSQDARVKRLTASSSAEDLRSLAQRLESTEAALRERTMQLAQALGVPRKSAP